MSDKKYSVNFATAKENPPVGPPAADRGGFVHHPELLHVGTPLLRSRKPWRGNTPRRSIAMGAFFIAIDLLRVC
jgi:hypothetical protein